jgi:hypothetical protein
MSVQTSVALDSFLQQAPSFVKIDIEGAEPEALDGTVFISVTMGFLSGTVLYTIPLATLITDRKLNVYL